MNKRSGVPPPPNTKSSGQPSLLKSPTDPPPFIGPEGASGAGTSVKVTPAASVVSTNRGVALGAAFTLSTGRQTTRAAATIGAMIAKRHPIRPKPWRRLAPVAVESPRPLIWIFIIIDLPFLLLADKCTRRRQVE